MDFDIFLSIAQTPVEGHTPDEDTMFNNFFDQLQSSGAQFAQSVNNAGVAFRLEPSPTESESEGLSKNIESGAMQLLNNFMQASPHSGRYFLNEVREACYCAIKSCIPFIEALIKVCFSISHNNSNFCF